MGSREVPQLHHWRGVKTAPTDAHLARRSIVIPLLGRSYGQIAREGWGEQKSQNGGANPILSGPGTGSYHLWAVAPGAQPAKGHETSTNNSLYLNSKVQIDTTLSALSRSIKQPAPEWLTSGLKTIDGGIHQLESKCPCNSGLSLAQQLAPVYRQTLALREARRSTLDARGKAGLLFELDSKINEFQSALANALGLDMIAFRNNEPHSQGSGFRGASADESSTSVSPGQQLYVQVHASQATAETRLQKVWLESRTGDTWKNSITSAAINPASPVSDPVFTVHVADNADLTAPYFTRPDIEQPYYDVSNPHWRGRPFAPYPLDAWAEFSLNGLPIRIGKVVQTLQRITGPGGFYEPLVVTPSIGVSLDPPARLLPPDGSSIPVRVTIHAQGPAEGTVSLKLPQGWRRARAGRVPSKDCWRYRPHPLFDYSCCHAHGRLFNQG